MRAIAKGCPLFARRAHNETHCVPWERARVIRGTASRDYRGSTYALGRHPHTTAVLPQWRRRPPNLLLLLLLSRKSFIFVNPFDREERKGGERGTRNGNVFIWREEEEVREGGNGRVRIWLAGRERKNWKLATFGARLLISKSLWLFYQSVD